MVANIEQKQKHLEFIQNVINRMANNSFLLKGWAVTVVAGVSAISIKEGSIMYTIVALALVAFFAALDLYYLLIERRFRHLYDDVRKSKEIHTDFAMDIKQYSSCKECWNAIYSPASLIFYAGLCIANIIIILLI